MYRTDQTDRFLSSGAIVGIDDQSVLIGFGAAERKKAEDLDTVKPAFYFPDFFLTNEKPWLQFEESSILSYDDFGNFLEDRTDNLPALSWTGPELEHLHRIYHDLQYEFSQNRLQKAVPYFFSRCTTSMTNERISHTVRNALKFARSYPYRLYGFWNETEGMFGATPEVLFSYRKPDRKNNRRTVLHTAALAGTSSKERSPHTLLNDPKECREHALVISGIRESLSGLGEITTENTSVVHFPMLNHLFTPITVKLSACPEFESIVQALHPTPALGAYPREEGSKWLRAYNKTTDRGRFGAPAGVLYDGGNSACCLVGIRNVSWNPEGMKIGAGCGMIKESRMEKEQNEILLKIRSVQEVLSL